MSKMFNLCGLEITERKVNSNCSEEDCFTKEDRKADKLIDSARAEMGDVKEENERLKIMLERVEKDYHSLQLRFFDILQRETSNPKKSSVQDSSATTTSPDEVEEHHNLVSLCLGTSSMESKKEGVICKSSDKHKENNEDLEANKLSLGLDSKSFLSMELVPDLSPMNNSEELIKEEAAEQRGTCSANKTVRDKDGVDEISEQNPTKRARVCVRARCDTPTMIDGCQWRKYGQKIAKGNPCPRAYYRCTVAPACPVRKQVQRCAEDMSILITTYEGTHNHPLPVSATAMASTTCAAVSMLLSGSSSTSSHHPDPAHHTVTSSFGNSSTLFNSLNFNNPLDQSISKQAFLPNTTASNLFPTITLDLTSTSPSSSSSTRLHFLPSSFASSPRLFHPLSLSFNNTPQPHSFSFKGLQNYATVPIEKNNPLNLGNQLQEQFYQQHCIKKDALAETLTRAISTDPSFRSAIAAAVSSIERKGSTTTIIRNQGGGENLGLGLSLKLGDNNSNFNNSSISLNQIGKGGLTSHQNRTSSSPSSSSSQGGNFMLLQHPKPFSLSKSSTTSSNIDSIIHWVQEINSHR